MEDGVQSLDRDAIPDEFILLRACGSLVRKSTSGRQLELAHFTVKEFLLGIDCDSNFSAYRVDVEQSEVELAKACLTYLTLQDFDSRVSWSREAQLRRHQEYAFRRYAVECWRVHAKDHLGGPDLLALVQKLLDPSKPGTFTTWTQDYRAIFGSREDDLTWCQDRSKAYESGYSAIVTHTPLHYASAFALPEICRWLLDCGCEVDTMSAFGTPLHHVLRGIWSLEDGEIFPSRCAPRRENDPRIKVIDILLEAGADPNSKSSAGLTPLSYASAHQDYILRLLQKGARYNKMVGLYPLNMQGAARDLLDMIGRENLHEEDYAFLLHCSMEEAAKRTGLTP